MCEMGVGREEEFRVALLFVRFVEFIFPDRKAREAARCGTGERVSKIEEVQKIGRTYQVSDSPTRSDMFCQLGPYF